MVQTNRTVLFDLINPEKVDLLTLIGESERKESLTDEKISEIHSKLEVHSFEEFMNKFSPSVNMLLDTNQREVLFSLKEIRQDQEVIRLDHPESLFNVLKFLIETKENKKYVLTGFDDMLHNIIPRKPYTLLYEDRGDLINRSKKLTERNRTTYKKRMKKVLTQYDDGVYLLGLFMENIMLVLDDVVGESVPNKGILDEDEDLQIKVVRRSSKYSSNSIVDYCFDDEVFDDVINECIAEMEQNPETKLRNPDLLRDCFELPVYIKQKRYEELQEKYSSYTDFYIKIIRRFWMISKPLIETMLGVWNFFKPYGNCEGMAPALLIANFAVADMLDEEKRERLDLFLNSVNSKSFLKNTIWYSILPNMITLGELQSRNVRERFKSSREQMEYQRNDTAEISLLLDLLYRHKIQTFLSLALTKDNTFSVIAKSGLDRVNENLAVFDKMEGRDYVIPCFPNFIVISEEEACISVGKQLEYDELEEKIIVKDNRYVWFDEIGVASCFVAAGLYAACQCPQYLKQFFKYGVSEEIPGVAYRITEKQHNLKTITPMLSETTEYSEDFIHHAMEKSKGILFGQVDGKMIIMTDRVLSYYSGDRTNVAMVQTLTYMERIIRYESQDYKKNLINQFFQRRPGSIISKWYFTQDTQVNSLLKENEYIEYKLDEQEENCTFSVYFNNSDMVRRETVSMFKEK